MSVRDRKEREFQRREREILEAALALFRRSDWQAVTIDEIAARAEIGKGTVYKHFETKDEIYARLAIDVYRRLLTELRKVDLGTEPSQGLRALIKVFWDVHVPLTAEYRRVVLYCERPDFVERLPAMTRGAMREVNGAITRLITEVIERAMATSALPRQPAALVMFVLQAAVFGAIRMAWTGCIPPGQEDLYLRQISDFTIAGLMEAQPERLAGA